MTAGGEADAGDLDGISGSLIRDLEARRRPSWQSPFHWWGPAWARPVPRDLDGLVGDGVVSAPVATRLREVVAAGGSVLVAAGPPGVGKSTVADALAGALPDDAERVYVRGGYETFDFLAAPPPARRALLVNELSPHLPIYLWGAAARRVLRLTRDGAQLIGTIHASTPEEVVYQLARPPVAATPDEIAAVGTVVFLGPPPAADAPPWRVERIVRLHATSHGVRVVEEEG